MAQEITPNVGLLIDSNLTPTAKQNLRKIDTAFGTAELIVDLNTTINGQNDIKLQPGRDTDATTRNIYLGTTAYRADIIYMYGTTLDLSGVTNVIGWTVSGIMNAQISSGAAIEQSKIAGLISALSGKADVGEAAAAVNAHEIAYVHTDIAHTNRAALDLVSGTNTGNETVSSIKSTLGAASVSADGYLTSGDWSTFSGKQDVLPAATALIDGYLDSNDFVTFNAKLSEAAQTISVAKSGRAFTAIQAAIDSISDASSSKPYVIQVYPGIYTETVTLKAWVFVKGIDIYGCIINGKVLGTLGAGESSGIDSMSIKYTPNSAADYTAVELTGDFVIANLEIITTIGASFSGKTVGLSMAANQIAYVGLIGVQLLHLTGTVTEYCGIKITGTAILSIYQSAVTINSLAATGDFRGFCLSNTGDTGARELLSYLIFYNPSFAGTVTGYSCTSVQSSNSVIRIIKTSAAVLKGAGGGTAYGSSLSTTGGAYFRIDGLTLHIDGFANEYISNTGSTDSQRLWITSTNKDLTQSAAGLTVATPQDQNQTGFVRWGGAGDYYSIDNGTGALSVLRAGAGVVRSTPVVWAAGQSVALTALATNYVYMTSAGVIGSTATPTPTLSINNILLLEAWWDGSTYSIVTKENHPYEFTTAVSSSWHKTFGSLVTGLGATITQLGASANRQLAIVGDDTVLDHGLETSITSAPATAATFSIVYTNASGKMVKDGADLTTFLSRYNNAGTAANAANNDRIVLRIGVIKDDLNSSSPKYVGCLHTAVYGSNSAALNAISAGNIVAFPAELKALEVVQLGFLVIQANGAGAGSIITGGVVVAKQAFGASLIGASSSAQASLITTSTTNFVAAGGVSSVLTGADVTVQAMADTLARGAANRYSAALSWSGSAGAYTMTITGATHLRGVDPLVRVRKLLSGSTYEVVITEVTIDDSNGDVVIGSTENFTGKVVIL